MTQTQDHSKWILERIQNNSTMIDGWFEMVCERIIKSFEAKGFILPYFAGLCRTEANREYHQFTITDIDDSDITFNLLRKQNYIHGYPIMICVFAAQIYIVNEDKTQQEALFITKETPLKRERQLYLIHDIEGKKKAILDDYMTKFTTLPYNVSRFGRIIEIGINPFN